MIESIRKVADALQRGSETKSARSINIQDIRPENNGDKGKRMPGSQYQ